MHTETTPLLIESGASTSDDDLLPTPTTINSTRQIGASDDPANVHLNVKNFASLFRDSVPGKPSSLFILSYILQNSIQTTSVVVAARLGPNELSVAAFSMMFVFVTGGCVALGGTTALDTLGSQAFTGGSKKTDLSIHFQRCLFVLWVLLIPVSLLWAFAEPVLCAFGQSAELSRNAQTFLRIMIFGMPGLVGFESLKKYLQCQGISEAPTLVLITVLPINLVLNVLLVHFTPLGVFGAAVAVSMTYWLCFALLALVTSLNPIHSGNGTWDGLQLGAVLQPRGCCAFLKLALPGILMVGTEWAAFEIVALAAGKLGEVPLAAQSVIMTTDQILNTLPFGIGVAASTRVGCLIGAQSPIGARNAAYASALLSVIVGSLVMMLLLIFKDVYGLLFSNDETVVRLVSAVMPLVASFQVADGLAGSCGGVLRGQGRQHLGALFNTVSYYVIALPMGITLAFTYKQGLKGLWIGQVVALFIVGIGELLVVVLGTNWEKEVEKGIRRNKEEALRQSSVITT